MNCTRCGVRLQQGMLICPECGARQRRQSRWVRCSACHRRVPVQLTVCPHCGRSIHPAGPRWGVWLAGIAVLVLLGAWGVRRLPLGLAWQRVVSVEEQLAKLIEIPELPAVDAVATGAGPVGTRQHTTAATASHEPAGNAAATEGVASTLAVSTSTPANVPPTSQAQPTVLPPTATPQPSALPQPTAQPTATPQPTVTATAQPTATPQPTVTATAQPTATSDANKYYVVQSGDSLALIGEKTGIDWQLIAAANNVNQNSMLHPGDKLLLPSAKTGSAAPATPARASKYIVQAGDSLALIGQKLGLNWQDIARANGLDQNSMLMPGQELTIP